MDLDDKVLQVLSCDISVRPHNAAGIQELLPFQKSLRASGRTVIIEFDKAGKSTVESFVEAERLCCTGLLWDLTETIDRLTLKITSTTDQVSLILEWFGQPGPGPIA